MRRKVEIRARALEYKEKSWFVFPALLAASLSACTNSDVQTIRIGNAGANALQQQLSMQYGELAFRKRAEGNSASAHRFELKARRAASGGDVAPDRPDNPDALKKYARLRTAVGGDAVPAAVRARAQVMFDCWLDERVQGVDPDDIRACEQEFERALAILDGGPLTHGAGAS